MQEIDNELILMDLIEKLLELGGLSAVALTKGVNKENKEKLLESWDAITKVSIETMGIIHFQREERGSASHS